jgi:hypothetical protein
MQLHSLRKTLDQAVCEVGLPGDSAVLAVLEYADGSRRFSPVVAVEIDEDDGSIDLDARHANDAAGLDVTRFGERLAEISPGRTDFSVFVFGEPQPMDDLWYRADIPVGIAVFNPERRVFMLASSQEAYEAARGSSA